VQAAFTGEGQPWELTLALLCEEWHRFPNEINDLPADDLLHMLKILGLYHKNYNAKAHESLE
jgi:hypothetical protein